MLLLIWAAAYESTAPINHIGTKVPKISLSLLLQQTNEVFGFLADITHAELFPKNCVCKELTKCHSGIVLCSRSYASGCACKEKTSLGLLCVIVQYLIGGNVFHKAGPTIGENDLECNGRATVCTVT